MQVTSLEIKPTRTWDSISEKNPLRAVVKLASKESTVECVLREETMRKMLDLVADEIAASAKENIDQFVAAVTAIDADKSAALIEGTSNE